MAMAKRMFVRVEADDPMGHKAKVFVVLEDESEIDISSVVQRVETDIEVGKLNTAKIHVIFTGVEAKAQVEEIVAAYIENVPFE